MSCCAGYARLEAGTFVGGSTIDITLELRTYLLDGLLLFAFGGTGTYFMLQLEGGSLTWMMSINGVKYPFTLNDDLINSTYLCDGRWHVIQLKRDLQMKLTIDSNAFVGGDPSAPANSIALSSYLYVGGIPHDDSEVTTFIHRNQLDQQIQRS